MLINDFVTGERVPFPEVSEGKQDWSQSSSPAGEAVIKSLSLLIDRLKILSSNTGGQILPPL